jgi:hypothetical protein
VNILVWSYLGTLASLPEQEISILIGYLIFSNRARESAVDTVDSNLLDSLKASLFFSRNAVSAKGIHA